MRKDRITIHDVEKLFGISKRDMSVVYILLFTLDVGESVDTLCGKIQKTGEHTLMLQPRDDIIHQLVNDLLPDYA